ncbi:MAG TPA: prolyl oligopeptidase family serine peptidase [Chitinophagaceae bacterium]|jgi:dipeptidyl aminopeptidase/acylaminoacyl peptidase|nr:prolyl oligopeptidase family serine peptidase [Chitinophagaceae bacterium]
MKKIFFLALIVPQFCFSQTIENYLAPPFPTDLIGSPDGKTIAWVFNDKGSRNIFVAEAPAFGAKAITSYSNDNGIEISNVEFTPDGSQIIFVRGNPPNNNGETANPAFLQLSTARNIFIVDKTGGQLKKVIEGSNYKMSPEGKTLAYISGGQIWTASLTDTSAKPANLFQSRGAQSQIRWSPDGKMIAFVSNRGDHSFIGIYRFLTKTVDFVETSMDNDTYPVWSPDGNQLAYIRVPHMNNAVPFIPVREGNPWSIRLYDIATGTAKELWRASAGRGSAFFNDIPTEENLLWWLEGGRLLFPYEKDGWQHLYELDINEGKIKLITPGNGEIENVTVSPDRRTVYYTTNIGDIDRRHIWKLSVADGKLEQLTKGDGIEWSPVITANGLAVLHSSAVKPAWPAVATDGSVHDIAKEFFPNDFPSNLVQPVAVKIKAKDGRDAYADLFLPPGHTAGEKHPALIFIHGGSRRQMVLGFHYSQYYSNAYALNQYFASKGYVVMSLNYRSGIGYGMEFREALNYGAAGASEVKDLLGAGEYLKSRIDVDGNKIALWGGSYGGYLTAHGLAQASNLFACGVDIHGVHNWNTEIPTFAPWYDYAKYPAIAKKAFESSPEYFVKGWKSPVLMIHGDDDRNVPFSESVNMAELLRKQGVHVEELVLPDEVHGFLLHKNWLKAYNATFEFIERQLLKK